MFVVQALAVQYNLTIKVTEFNTDDTLAWKDLSIVAYNATNKTANCTFKWNASLKVYDSNCSSDSTTTTATVAQIQVFDTVVFYNNSVYLYTLNNSTNANAGLTDAQLNGFFSGVTAISGSNVDLPVTLASKGLFIAKFTSDISKVNMLVFNDTMTKNHTVYQCDNKLLAFAILDTAAANSRTYRLMGYQNSDRVFAQNFSYLLTDPKNSSQPYDFSNVSIPIVPATNATSAKGNPVNQTRFLMNLTDFINKTTKTSGNDNCDDVIIRVFSNNSQIQQIPNGGVCVVSVVSNTDLLVPFTDFIINATFTSTGAVAFATKARLTPRMISEWVETAQKTANTVYITLDAVNVSRITGGEIAAIVIGSFIGLVMIIIALVFFFRWCTYGMMAPAAVAPKMM